MAEILKERKQFLDAAEYYEKVGDELNKRICIGFEKIYITQKKSKIKKKLIESIEYLKGSQEFELIAQIYFTLGMYNEAVQNFKYFKNLLLSSPNSNQDISKIKEVNSNIKQIYFLKANILEVYIKNEKDLEQNYKELENFIEKDGQMTMRNCSITYRGCKNEVGNVSLSTSFIRLQNFLLFNITIFPRLISFNREIQYIIDSSIYIHTKKQEKSEQIIKNAIKALHEIWDSISDEIVSNTIDQINVNLREVSANNVKFKENNLIEKEDLIHILHYYYPKILELKLEQIMQINANENNKKILKDPKTALGKILIDQIQQLIIPFQEEFVRIAKSRQNMEFFQEQQKFFNQLSNTYELKILDQDKKYINGYYLMIFYQQELSHQIFIDQILQNRN
ncbi:hypothetical protein ABPG72_019457 [Tetrahymena utriculariae]